MFLFPFFVPPLTFFSLFPSHFSNNPLLLSVNVMVTFGMDRDTQLKLRRKNDNAELRQEEERIIDWLEEISGEDIKNVYETLKRARLLFLSKRKKLSFSLHLPISLIRLAFLLLG
jgi:hypothetical protein